MEPNQVMLIKGLHPLKHFKIFLDLFHLLDKVSIYEKFLDTDIPLPRVHDDHCLSS